MTRHFEAVFDESNRPKRTDLLTLILMFSVQAGLQKLSRVDEAESEMKQSKCYQCYNCKKMLTRHFEAIFEKSNSTNVTDLLTLIQMFIVQAGLHKMFEVDEAESEVEQSKCHQCVTSKKVN